MINNCIIIVVILSQVHCTDLPSTEVGQQSSMGDADTTAGLLAILSRVTAFQVTALKELTPCCTSEPVSCEFCVSKLPNN